MSFSRYLAIVSAFVFSLAGCDDKSVPGDLLTPSLPSVSARVDGRTITLSAEFGAEDNIGGITEYGFCFGTDEGSLERCKVARSDGLEYSLVKENLEWSTSYLYKAWIGNGRDEMTSELMSVRTGDIPDGPTPSPDEIIRFEDPAVKAICIANWDLNADGELSREEAGMVADIGFIFKRNREIVSFEEFECFAGLKSLPDSAFMYCESLCSVRLPQSVSIVGEHAFEGCRNLSSVTLPDSLKVIGHGAFASCGSLLLDKLPQSLVKIDDAAFGYCDNLAVSSLPESIVEIGHRAFVNCRNITITKLPPLLKIIEGGTFQECSKMLVEELPQELVSIGDYAFVNNSIERMTIPASVRSIGEYAFDSCESLATVTVLSPEPPDSYNSLLGEYARVIYVPSASLDKYRTASGWSRWKDKYRPVDSE